jgi:predicted AAA+ superfamily ATPase
MLQRLATSLLRERLRASPAVALLGPRQSGKTTLARALGGRYFDLEQAEDRLRLDLQWSDATAGRELMVLDEAQAWPEVFPRLRGAIDARRGRRGRFLLLGSVAPALMAQVSESLAGRLAIVELSPLLLGELPSVAARARHWLCGGFPDGGVLTPRSFPLWGRDFLALLSQRDLPAWGLPAKPQQTDRLMRMVAALHGQPWNASQVGRGLGLSYHTVNGYLDHLVGAFLVRRLPAFHGNVRKRLVRSPKVYWRDSGLLHALWGVADEDALLAHPSVGASFEGYVVEQALCVLSTEGRGAEARYLRTSDQHELDLVLDLGRERWAIEAKLTASPGPRDLRRLDAAADLVEATRRFLVCRVPRASEDATRTVCDLPTFLDRLRAG